MSFLRVMNVLGTFCEITVIGSGNASWEYWPFSGSGADPGRLTRIVAEVLGAACPDFPVLPPELLPGLTVKGVSGRALRGCGLEVQLDVIGRDTASCEIYAGIEVTNPAAPERGIASADDHGVIGWHCCFPDNKDAPGDITPTEFAETIARILAPSRLQPEPE